MKTETDTFTFSSTSQVVNTEIKEDSELSLKGKTLSQTIHDNNSEHFFEKCLVDSSGKQFACKHEQCLELCSCINSELPEKNRGFHALHFYPEDRMLWCDEIIPEIQKYIDLIPRDELPLYRFSFNHRYIREDGDVSQFLHEGTLAFSDENCHPVMNLKVFTEIGDIKTDDTLVLTLFRYSVDKGYQKAFKKVYGETQNGQLSLREREIIKLCLEGLTSKMIADKLNLSVHTVKNHKRNSMEKTLTHNIAELINLCIRSRWL